MKKSIFSICLSLYVTLTVWGQIPDHYYSAAYGKAGSELQVSLFYIIADHQQQSYSSLWTHFYSTDARSDGAVWDIYSDIPGGSPPYSYTFGTDQCGNYSAEGDCYNREHSVPKSWFNDQYPMYTDLYHLYPTDGFVNGKRGNLPFGEVMAATWTSRNGSKVGNNSAPGYNGNVFEPIDDFKGDLARTYFYMCTRYIDKSFDYDEGARMFSGSQLKPWALDMLIRWHQEDPVSEKEIERNEAIYLIQKNRNPFVDYPELVGKIFGADSVFSFYPVKIENYTPLSFSVFPNPTKDKVVISSTTQGEYFVKIVDLQGREFLFRHTEGEGDFEIDLSPWSSGIYFILFETKKGKEVYKIVKY